MITAVRLTMMAKQDPRMMSVTAVKGRIKLSITVQKTRKFAEIMMNMPLITGRMATSLAELNRLQNSL